MSGFVPLRLQLQLRLSSAVAGRRETRDVALSLRRRGVGVAPGVAGRWRRGGVALRRLLRSPPVTGGWYRSLLPNLARAPFRPPQPLAALVALVLRGVASAFAARDGRLVSEPLAKFGKSGSPAPPSRVLAPGPPGHGAFGLLVSGFIFRVPVASGLRGFWRRLGLRIRGFGAWLRGSGSPVLRGSEASAPGFGGSGAPALRGSAAPGFAAPGFGPPGLRDVGTRARAPVFGASGPESPRRPPG